MDTWKRALAVLRLEPTFGVRSFTPQTTCGDVHPYGPIPKGDPFCCMASHCTGHEGNKGLSVSETDKVGLKNWKPETPNGKDPWSTDGHATATPTRYAPDPSMPVPRRERRAAKVWPPIDPSGKATPAEMARLKRYWAKIASEGEGTVSVDAIPFADLTDEDKQSFR